MKRIDEPWSLWMVLAAGLAVCTAAARAEPARARPNVIVVITDDQGYGDLSAHGNPVLKTPHLDRLRGESVRFSDFHVAPMCTPTRGQLMTGVDAMRNGAINVSSGRALLRREFPTMADIFTASGWRTGLFGKWHLGDSHPFRPQDRGFEESLWFPSSHIGSVPDAWENDYFDDTYVHNGRRTKFEGYTTDVFFREAMGWMKRKAESAEPFFCYLATAAPHWPHFVPDHYRAPVREALRAAQANLSDYQPGASYRKGTPLEDELVSWLSMITNIDDNVGLLERFLADAGLRDTTIVIFLNDNGSTFGHRYYNAGMTGGKVTLWEGGHRVSCFIRWPTGPLRPPSDIAGLTQVQDLLPTLIDLLGLRAPAAARFDGISLAPVLRGEAQPPADRMLVINYSRMPHGSTDTGPGSKAVPTREGAAVLWKQWRLLEDNQLYDLSIDPLQKTNLINHRPKVLAAMRAHLDAWWAGVKDCAVDFEAVSVGHDAENPVTLTGCEWADVFIDQQAQVRRGERKNGLWHIEVAKDGQYMFTLRRWPTESGLRLTGGVPEIRVTDGTLPGGPGWPVAWARLRGGGVERSAEVAPDAEFIRFVVPLSAGRTTLKTWFLDSAGETIGGAYYVDVERLVDARALPPETVGPVPIILDTDMSGDADDAGTMAVLHALADLGECEILATLVNRKDLANASAAAVSAINTYYGRPDLPIGTDKAGPTALQRTSPYTPGLRDGFPHGAKADDEMPDALEVYRRVLAVQPDRSVTVCSVGALSNLAELWRREPDLVRAKICRVVVMGGKFPSDGKPETNIATHPEPARLIAAEWPTEIVWQGFDVGNTVMTGEKLKTVPAPNPVRRAFELRQFRGRPSIDGGQPSYDQAALLYAVRGPDPDLWTLHKPGRVIMDETGNTEWSPDPAGLHVRVERRGPPEPLAEIIEALMIRPPSRTP